MNKELARKLLFIVNDKNIMSELDEYIQFRIEYHRDQLESLTSDHDYHRGCINELRRFKTLKEEVHKAAV
jgi:hypothetical protein